MVASSSVLLEDAVYGKTYKASFVLLKHAQAKYIITTFCREAQSSSGVFQRFGNAKL